LLFLGIDTATRVGSVGLVRAPFDGLVSPAGEPGRIADGCVEIAEVARDSGLAHGAEILALIDDCLERGGVALEDVGCIAVSSGPGSFTGLRVALATAKGLALGGDLPLVGVPTLEALAATVLPGWTTSPVEASAGIVVAACLDARKGEVYGAGFVIREPAWEQPNPRLERRSADAACRPDAFASELAGWLGADRPGLLVGDGAQRYAEQILAPLGARVHALPFPSHAPRGAIVARLGAGLFAQGGSHDRAALVPSYARASEAEIVRARRSGGAGPR
jgi:tRNA threonylcarbamoyladenosine biosynthesis protein TsaB